MKWLTFLWGILMVAPFAYGQADQGYNAMREAMVETQIAQRDIKDERVLKAMREVPRHLFVPESLKDLAYSDTALPIGWGQTISQPYIVGVMLEKAAIQPTYCVLEIGAGSGYQAALLGQLAREVYTIEIVPELAYQVSKLLKKEGYKNIHVLQGDGHEGWSAHAPYDVILVTACTSEVPQALWQQLKNGGVMIMPLEKEGEEKLVRLTKKGNACVKETFFPVRFVPFVQDPV